MKNSHKDYVIATLIIILLLVCFDDYRLRNIKPKSISERSTKMMKEVKPLDSVITVSEESVRVAEVNVSKIHAKKSSIVKKSDSLVNVIKSTEYKDQFAITKSLCQNTGDSVNLKEINYCLQRGAEQEELYQNSVNEVYEKDKIISSQEMIISMKDSIAIKALVFEDEIISENMQLTDGLETQTRRKRIWRSVASGAIAVSLVLAAILVL